MSDEPEKSKRKIAVGVGQGGDKIAKYKYAVYNFPTFVFNLFRCPLHSFVFIMGIIQMTTPYGPQSCSVPLLVILFAAGMKEGFDDYKRRKSDKQVNYQVILAYDKLGGWREITYSKLQAGMIVYVTKGASFPADLVLLSSSEPAGIAYIETSNLDGETNLKIRKGLPQTASLVERDSLTNCLRDAVAFCEQPNKRLYSFQGSMQIAESDTATATATVTGTTTPPPSEPNNQDAPLDKSQFLQRGAKLRNTDWVYGLVVYAGKETKCMLNSVRTKRKNARIHQLANYLMLCQFGMLLMVTIIYTYILHVDIISFLVTFSSLVPISLFVTINTIQLFQAFLIRTDLEMYDQNNDIAAEARNSMLTAELGEVKYVMVDKTGTLTRNKMVFKNCSVGGVMYGSEKDESFDPRMVLSDLKSNRRGNAEDLQQFLTACAVCHTVVPEKKGDTVVMHASSPDEYELVNFAYNAGFKLHTHTPTMTVFTEMLGDTSNERQFEVLQVLEFDSVCKRMGVILRDNAGGIRVYVKGSEQAVCQILGAEGRRKYANTAEHLDEFGQNGLRTLCFAYRVIDAALYNIWLPYHIKAQQQCESPYYQQLRCNSDSLLLTEMDFIGVSAVQDCLQEGVEETVVKMKDAGMRVWMLTGDHKEAACSTAYASGIIAKGCTTLLLDEDCCEDILDLITTWKAEIGKENMESSTNIGISLVVARQALEIIIADDRLLREFLPLALACHCVICCQCTPQLKAAVTRLVRETSGGCVIAVGDGVNDVAMMQEAHVGVGIHGQEGSQAAMSADFSIAQFKHLDRLLFVHGSLSLFRTNRALLYTIYQSVLEMAVAAFFSAFSGFSPQIYTDPVYIICYALWFTILPVLLGMFDRPVSIDALATSSAVYRPMQNSFSLREYIKFLATAVVHAFVVFISNHQLYGHFGTVYRNGREMYLGSFGFTVFYCLVAVSSTKALIESHSLNWPMAVAAAFSMITPIIFMFEQSMAYPHVPWSQRTSAGLLEVVPDIRFLLFIIYIIGSLLILEIIFKSIFISINRRLYAPLESQPQQTLQIDDELLSSTVRPTGYAFAQDDGSVISQSEMMSAYHRTAIPEPVGSNDDPAEVDL